MWKGKWGEYRFHKWGKKKKWGKKGIGWTKQECTEKEHHPEGKTTHNSFDGQEHASKLPGFKKKQTTENAKSNGGAKLPKGRCGG